MTSKDILSQFRKYISIIPGFEDFISDNSDIMDMNLLVSKFKDMLVSQNQFNGEMDLMLKILLEKWNEVRSSSINALHYINESLALNDSNIINEFIVDEKETRNGGRIYRKAEKQHYKTITEKIVYDKVDYSTIIHKYVDCGHPYIYSKIACAYLNSKLYDIGLHFLKKSLYYVFSYPNVYWHNPLGVYGCTDALFEFQHLLGREGMNNLAETPMEGSTAILKLLFLHLTRAIDMCDNNKLDNTGENEKSVDYYKIQKCNYLSMRGDLIFDYQPEFSYIFGMGINPIVQCMSDKALSYAVADEIGLGQIAYQCYQDALKLYRHEDLVPNFTGGLLETEDATLGELIDRGHVRSERLAELIFTEYNHRMYYHNHCTIDLYIRFLKNKLENNSKMSLAEFVDQEKMFN